MKLQALRLHNVRRFAGRGVAIEGIAAGVNVLCAANEHGKSTSFEALHALFFQPHTGTAKDIRRLQPYSGGNPLVEADIEVDGGRYRLRKRFLGQRLASVTEIASGRLVAQADEAERFIGELVRGGAAGPAGLLWVRQGLTGLEEGSRREVDEERRVRESLLTSVQGEVEAITGGRRMSRIIEACMAELGLIATATLRPKTGGPYAAALDDRARYEAEERRLLAEVTALREALDARARAQKRLAELEKPEERQSLRSAAAAAEAALADAKAHGAALAALEAETVFARGRHDTAERELQRYRAALERARDLDRELAAAEAAAAAARTRRGE
ncbi:ATP-binding protein, partial [Bosea sp. TWI1241]|uniref:AAA family ATPase n=1 Tax=Bosea sp. TWI1241 TaxID=3148904 RepID=UPI003209DEDB